MRIIYTLILLISIVGLGHSQNDRIYTMFVFNKLQYNPAYTGAKESLHIGAHYRHQWQGITGAPRTITAFAHTPLAQGRSGLGFTVVSDEIGIFKTSISKVDYAYRIGLKNGTKLSVGLSAQYENTRFDWTKADLIDINDNSIPFSASSANTFNMGVGIYYTGSKFYIGASVPNFMKNAITSEAYQGFGKYNNFRPYYLMGGLIFKVNSDVYIRPSLLVSYIKNAPIDVDFNLSMLFLESFWIGASYRLNESLDAFVQFPITKQIKLAVGVDYALTELNQFAKGSGEIMLEYIFKKDDLKVNNIRFF